MLITTADRRSAHRRVGAAAIAAFLVLLLLALIHRPAQAEPTVPVATPAATPSIQPTQPGPSQSLPADPDPYANPGFGRDRGFGPRGGGEGGGLGQRGGDDDGGGFGGGSAPSVPSDPGGGGAAPAPSTGGSQT